MTPALSVLVPTCNDDLRLEIVLRALMVQDGPPFEIVVVNDGGHDITQETIQRILDEGFHCPNLNGVQYLYLSPPSTLFRAAATRNLGIKHCQGSRLVFCDTDTVPAPGFLEYHAQGRQELLVGLRRRVAQSAVESVNPSQVTEEWLQRNVCEEDSRTIRPVLIKAYQDLPGGREPHVVIYTCNLSAPIQMIRAIGGFDESFVGWGGEDEDLGIRLMKAGIQAHRTPALVYHLNHDSRSELKASAHLQETRHQSVVRVGPLPKLEPIYL